MALVNNNPIQFDQLQNLVTCPNNLFNIQINLVPGSSLKATEVLNLRCQKFDIPLDQEVVVLESFVRGFPVRSSSGTTKHPTEITIDFLETSGQSMFETYQIIKRWKETAAETNLGLTAPMSYYKRDIFVSCFAPDNLNEDLSKKIDKVAIFRIPGCFPKKIGKYNFESSNSPRPLSLSVTFSISAGAELLLN